MRQPFKHMTLDQRKTLEEMHRKGVSAKEIARATGVSLSSIYKELKRGSVDGVYSAAESQRRYEAALAEKGRAPIIPGDERLQTFIRHAVLEENQTLGEIVRELRQNKGLDLPPVSRQTIYTAIVEGNIPGLTAAVIQNNYATVQKDRSVYFPKWFLKKYHIEPGQKFALSVRDGNILLEPAQD